MSVKNTAVGTVKQIIAEIVGNGRLAREGERQAAGNAAPGAEAEDLTFGQRSVSAQNVSSGLGSSPDDENRFANLLGHAALKIWADLPRDAQERLFAAAVGDGNVATALAEFLHDRHPRTAHPRQSLFRFSGPRRR
ncbi:hypothetical protein [Bradyrhizobium sp. USDA 4454]